MEATEGYFGLQIVTEVTLYQDVLHGLFRAFAYGNYLRAVGFNH